MRLEFLRAHFCLLLFKADFFCGGSALANETELSLPTDFNSYEIYGEFFTTETDTFITEDINTSTTSMSSGTQTVWSNTSPSASSPPPSSSEFGTVVCLILLFCFLILLFFCLPKKTRKSMSMRRWKHE